MSRQNYKNLLSLLLSRESMHIFSIIARQVSGSSSRRHYAFSHTLNLRSIKRHKLKHKFRKAVFTQSVVQLLLIHTHNHCSLVIIHTQSSLVIIHTQSVFISYYTYTHNHCSLVIIHTHNHCSLVIIHTHTIFISYYTHSISVH